jgi:drug/metabolite transporter (DMT)-like permease
MTLIRVSSAARVSSLFYLVPPATAIEAFLVFGERFGPMAIAGLVLASLGVALVVAPTS